MTARPKDDKPHYLEHRQRLRERFVAAGEAGLQDYEVLELILFMAIPRRDVKPLAKRLLEEFGGFAPLCNADIGQLVRRGGISENTAIAIKSVEAAAIRLARKTVIDQPYLSSFAQIEQYLRTRLSHRKKEYLLLLLLDSRNRLVRDHLLWEGTVNHAPAYPREIVKLALEHGATAMVLVHNHPSGDATPSRADIALTREIAAAAKSMDIQLHDHLIVARDTMASFRSLGLLE